MEDIAIINDSFIELNTDFTELILAIQNGFAQNKIIIPTRHHHDFPNPKVDADSTLLLMPAWRPSENAGVKIVTINPENGQFDLPSIQGTYVYFDATTGVLKSILEAKSLTAKRTAATSALASSYLSRKDASSLLMIGTGSLSTNLIRAHASVRPIKEVFVWGRNFGKATLIAKQLDGEEFGIIPIHNIKDKISAVDIISCATLSNTPLVLGDYLKEGQHIDLVGAYNSSMRESDDQTILRTSIFVDSFDGAKKEAGDIVIPLQNGIITEEDIKGDLFDLCANKKMGRTHPNEITLFKSVGHALEDLVAADYYFKKINND
jgi:ornithine cyclodeaminase